jgi:hypothetical protein
MGRMKSSWDGFSLEKKLSVVIIPLATTLIATLVPIFLVGGNDGAAARKREGLDVVGLSVRNGPDSPPEVEILLTNEGDVVSVIDRVSFRVLAFQPTDRDGCPMGGGDVPVSKTYELTLPAANGQGQIRSVDTPRQLQPNQAERLRIRASLDDSLAPGCRCAAPGARPVSGPTAACASPLALP